MVDSPRWCDTCQKWGDHHTDRCPTTFDAKSADEHQWDMMQTQRRAMGLPVKPYPGDAAAQQARTRAEVRQTAQLAARKRAQLKARKATRKASGAVSAQYPNKCSVCGADPFQPCRTRITRRVTDTHLPRIEEAYA